MNTNHLFMGLTALSGFTLSSCQGKQEARKPNIIYILADDLGQIPNWAVTVNN